MSMGCGVGQRETSDVSTSLQVEGLDVYSNYSIRVAAISGGGVGQRSVPIFCRTHESGKESIEGPLRPLHDGLSRRRVSCPH
ncbi:Down syndrome cell adhesion molecule protein Dscam2-like [Tropilaelaps mercedesae]|uniref:Down syndrome cell adhesion molecule protein Dscam2-like n=1 Tax=Tropilaelaps mercedesae TaxID=418985 RepID=A0A1V9X5N1_9ACAR|nr:Down syndrome cell adhesion molecule protein Dscam2-like [Tropilaelaps mercedesae]